MKKRTKKLLLLAGVGGAHTTSSWSAEADHPRLSCWIGEMKPYQRLQNWWEQTASDVVTKPASPQQVESLESRYNIRLPDDFREYLLNACPVSTYEWDAEYSTFWGIERIKNIPDEYPHHINDPHIRSHAIEYLFFADHFIWAWAWAICCSNDENFGKIALIGGTDRFVTDCFSEFVDRYTSDFRSLC